MNRVRIFISSPGDVADERQRALAVVERLQEEFRDALSLEPLLWEQEPLLATADFQSQIRSPADFDIFATIIGGRLGSPLGAQFTRRDGTPYASGTEFEFEMAVAGHHAKAKPEVLVYRKSNPPAHALTPQREKVAAFFNKWFVGDRRSTAIDTYYPFQETSEFEQQFEPHLREMLHRFLPRPNNLPEPISSFVGRTELIGEVTELVRSTETRLINLIGPAGVGKSRLALRVALGLLPEFADGAFLVNLSGRREGDLVATAIAETLGIAPAPGQPILDRVVAELEHREIVLLIDNLEQVQATAGDIGTLVAKCPLLNLVITSREVLRAQDVQVVRVPPFELPAADSTFAEIRAAEAVELFTDRALAVREKFELTEKNAGDVLAICRLVEGLPRAIELAAARMRLLNPAKILAKLRKGTLLRGIEVSIDAPAAMPAKAARIAVVISGFRALVAAHLTVDFGDASPPLELALGEHTPLADGSLRLEFEHEYASSAGAGIILRAEVRAAGALGCAESAMAAGSR